MQDRNNPQTLVAVEPPTFPTMDLLPPPPVDPPAFPAPRRSTGTRLARLARLVRRLRGRRHQGPVDVEGERALS